MSFFEIADTSSEEIYYTLAMFDDLETAKKEVLSKIDKDCAMTDSGDYDDYEKIEIRQHDIGWGNNYKILVTIERHKTYDNDSDSFEWETEVKEFKV